MAKLRTQGGPQTVWTSTRPSTDSTDRTPDLYRAQSMNLPQLTGAGALITHLPAATRRAVHRVHHRSRGQQRAAQCIVAHVGLESRPRIHFTWPTGLDRYRHRTCPTRALRVDRRQHASLLSLTPSEPPLSCRASGCDAAARKLGTAELDSTRAATAYRQQRVPAYTSPGFGSLSMTQCGVATLP